MRVRDLMSVLADMRGTEIMDTAYHLRLAGDWLLRAQDQRGGYAHSYSLIRGWRKPYPETTGYIIPSMIKLGEHLAERKYTQSAYKAGEWLLGIQHEDGSFFGLNGEKEIFDTGQIIEGMVCLYAKTGKEVFLDSAVKAAEFILKNQDVDGKWVSFAYRGIPHSYYSRVSANLLELYLLTKENRLRKSAEKNLSWVMRQQNENGYFNFSAIAGERAPYLHNIIYVLQGLWGVYRILRYHDLFTSVMKTVNKLLEIENVCGILRSQYDSSWRALRNEYCLTGIAQWSGLLSDIAVESGMDNLLPAAEKSAEYLKIRQIKGGSSNVKGALPGSFPVWGSYFAFAFNNWTAKFFIDAVMKSGKIGGGKKL